MKTRVLVTLLIASSVASVRVGRAGAEDEAPSRDELIRRAQQTALATRDADQGDRDAKKLIQEAFETLEGSEEEVRERFERKEPKPLDERFAHAYNELLTVAAYHDLNLRGEYFMIPSRVALKFSSMKTVRALSYAVPRTGRWRLERREWKGDRRTAKEAREALFSQLRATLIQQTPSGETLRKIKIWCYRWDTVYSGVGGENAKKLARVILEAEREALTGERARASRRVVAHPLNREFRRAYYYVVEGVDPREKAHVRRRNYYVKGSDYTVNFEVISYLERTAKDDDCTAWLRTVDGPECDAFLASLAPHEE